MPSLYEVSYHEDGTVAAVTARDGAPETRCTKRIIQDMDEAYFPTDTIIPSTEIVHDRVMLELFRGCIRGCRFCQAGYCYRPVRRRRARDLLIRQGIEALSGLRLSGDDPLRPCPPATTVQLEGLCDGLLDYCDPQQCQPVPALPAGGRTFPWAMMEQAPACRASRGITFAPEAGTQRLRDAINKNVTGGGSCCNPAAPSSRGRVRCSVKLYFMLGLPTETDEDVLGIADLAE